MDGLKRRRNSKQTNEISSDVFVTVAPELEKKTKSHSRSQRTLKIAIMGKPGVGKSALAVRYLTKRFIGEYQSSVEYHASTEFEIEEEKLVVEIFDTCASEEKISKHIKWADGFILVFSITDYWSLYEVARLSSIISQTKNDKKTPIVVICNKTDMEKQRRISRTEANQFLNDLGKPVFQASAASSYDSVRTAFDETSRLVYKWKFADGRKRQRSRSGSIMDPLRDALTRLSKSPSSEEIPYETRPRHSSVDLSQVSLVVSPLGSIKDGRCLSEQKPTKDMHRNNNFLQIPSFDQVIHFKRERSHSFA
ncbi:ras-related and estrogen-regulated growth inhibitor-like isoform X3 [Xenia sp. Carnegie-2017]|nr:ras-related and estrogen-regulated growth inhibitor-like isoform X3 [Xenia sp. Carnegie-2017]XP_046851275.1 ras-related and estrogen-regulated growth inhibitor-like isoform X3 [Xenia sp. Carnegie-2017]XP_046851276.1 ras-related and estrogen-regulated growth inhibitor-like isoform X3 [Xenia sp. Carnegie-2017]XP_046851277.1 ras-related and estrogen-regulated growth inhibitor-like isoform X3 [Xenia sp. Carnegie-2017]